VIPSYCITLAEEPWRLLDAQQEFERAKVAPKIVSAFHGTKLGLHATSPHRQLPSGTGEFLTFEEVGCALSHLTVLRMALATEEPEFLVFEDDVKLPEDFWDRFHQFRDACQDAEIGQLSYVGEKGKPAMAFSNKAQRIFYPFSTACMWWTAKAAAFAIQACYPVSFPYDILLIYRVFPFVKHVAAVPQLGSEKSFGQDWPSTIQEPGKLFKVL